MLGTKTQHLKHIPFSWGQKPNILSQSRRLKVDFSTFFPKVLGFSR